jgi:glycine oxidase
MTAQSPLHIIGGGVAGLGIGWRMAAEGRAVEIYDQGEIGRGASWAAAGMLAAILESEPGEEALLPFLLEAQKRWVGFARELKLFTGLDIGYAETGTLFAAAERDDLGELRHRHDYFAKRGIQLQWLNRSELAACEPCLSPRAHSALFSANDHQVDNRALTEALIAACKKSGGALHAHSPVEKIIIENNRVAGLVCNGKKISASEIVLAAGAWSGAIKGLPEKILPPVYPLKGQMLALQMDPARPILRHVLWTPRVYLVPRADGRLIIGATMEDRGFESTARAGSVLHLLREAFEILPGIEELPLIESWVGFRPTSRDDAPILGPSGIQGLTYATGQHRHGILLTPLIADLIADYIRSGALQDEAMPFTMKRFA